MKKELDIILRYLDHDNEEILNLRDFILKLDILQQNEIENLIEYLSNSIAQVNNIESHDYLGYYYFFLGSAYYEKGEYITVIESLESTISQLWEAQVNKSLAYWLLGISYSHLNEYPKARGALQEALNILWVNTGTNSSYIQEQQQAKSAIRKRIDQDLINLNNKSTHYMLPSKTQGPKKPPKFIDKIKKTFTPKNTSLPEQTSYEQSSEEKSEDFNPTPVPLVKSHTIHVTIPIDVNALEHIPIDSDCLTPDLAKKLRDFTESLK
jgi:tetratricopeptide (TPR) repeat protein